MVRLFGQRFLAIVPVLLGWSAMTAVAKIGDCPAVVLGDMVYSSHANAVQAHDRASGAVRWRTELFPEGPVGALDPALEQDVQMNIACVRAVRAGQVVATDRTGRTFRLRARDGRPLAPAKRP